MKFDFLSKKVGSACLILNSIKNDYAVYKWFLFLVKASQMRRQLRNYKETNVHYTIITILSALQILLYITSIVCVYHICTNKQYEVAWILLLLLVVNHFLFVFKRKSLIKLVAVLLDCDFPDNTVADKTLYQLSEEYAQKLSLPSIVDTIYMSEKVLKVALVVSYVLTAMIFVLEIWWCLVLVACAHIGVYYLSNSLVFYRWLKA